MTYAPIMPEQIISTREAPRFPMYSQAVKAGNTIYVAGTTGVGVCPATFRAEYLPAGATAHCIDFILTAGEVTAESTALVFAEKEPLGYVSDHIGLRARVSLMPGTPGIAVS